MGGEDSVMLVDSKGPIVVMWTVQTCMILVNLVAVGAAMIYLRFCIVPLMMAYFLIFLMAPVLDLLEKRPFACPCGKMDEESPNIYETTYESKMLCISGYEDEKRASIIRSMRAKEEAGEIEYGASAEDTKLEGVELILMGKAPHGLACLLTLVIVVLGMSILGSIISASFSDFAAAEKLKVETCEAGDGTVTRAGEDPTGGQFIYQGEDYGGETNCGTIVQSDGTVSDEFCLPANAAHPRGCEELKLSDKLTTAQNDFVDVTLLDMGVKIWKSKFCKPNVEKIAVMQEADADNNWIVNTYVYGMQKAASQQGEYYFVGNNASSNACDPIPLFPANPDGTPLDEMLESLGSVALVVNDVVLVLMLALFILFERPIGKTFDSDSVMIAEIEEMVMSYIGLKFIVSALTGALVAVFMEVASVKIGMVWGLLSFLLNFIPNVGSMIAMVLPLPFIMLDDELEEWARWVALLGPAMVQGYVGNVMEPALFGAALNLTEISVLLGLVFFAAIWGLPGAVLSVPILGYAKIHLHNIDHPMARAVLETLRQDVDLDTAKDLRIAAYQERLAKLTEYEDTIFAPTDADRDAVAADAAAAAEEKAAAAAEAAQGED